MQVLQAQTLPDLQVALCGDAAHTTSPMLGQGEQRLSCHQLVQLALPQAEKLT